MTMWKKILMWVGIFIVIGLVLFALAKWGQQSTQETAANPEISVITATDHTKGPTDAKAILVEYGDFQCPACGVYEPLVEKLLQEKGDKMLLVYRNFPLPSHQFAMLAATSAEAAGAQGKYWEMHDKIFAEQAVWSKLDNPISSFIQYAKDLGLDVDQFQKDLTSDVIKQKIADDKAGGIRFKVDATPTFFLNGKHIQPQSYDEFKNLVTTALGN